MRINNKIIAIILCVWCIQSIHAQDPVEYRKGKIKNRLSAGPVMSFYKNHPKHTINTHAKTGFCASYKSEILLGRRINFLIGLEYFNQGLSFKGYYSAPGYTYLFDKTFAYNHEIRIQELQLPFGFKKAINNEKDNFYTPYFFGGAGGRFIIGSYYVITNDSTENVVYDGKGTMNFEHHALSQVLNTFSIGKGKSLSKQFNAFFYGGVGTQYNFRETGKALFFEMTFKYGISRLHYEGYQNSNDLNIKESHLGFSIGLKF